MTHAATLETLTALRTKRISCGDSYTAKARELYRRAAEATATAKDYLDQGADFSEILRHTDPDNAADYPDPREPAETVVAELRAIADLIEQTGLPARDRGIGIEVNIHGVTAAAGAAFTDAIMLLVDDAHLTQRERFMSVEYNTDAPGVDVEYALFLNPEPKAAEPFVKAIPTEVAEAYASSASYRGIPVGVDPDALRDVARVGFEERAADVAAADELERQGREMDDSAERRLDQADEDAYQDCPGDQDEPVDEPADTEPDTATDAGYMPVVGQRVKVVSGQHRGRHGHIVSGSGNFWQYVALEADGFEAAVTVRVACRSITPAPLDDETEAPE